MNLLIAYCTQSHRSDDLLDLSIKRGLGRHSNLLREYKRTDGALHTVCISVGMEPLDASSDLITVTDNVQHG